MIEGKQTSIKVAKNKEYLRVWLFIKASELQTPIETFSQLKEKKGFSIY